MADSQATGSTRSTAHNALSSLTAPCRRIDEIYEKVDYVSQGTYGLVFKARNKQTNEVVAIKQVKLTDSSSNSASSLASRMGFPLTALREINVLLSLSHDNIIKVSWHT
jgi:cell division cycle 2-like protein